jgi:Transmembrane domain of unknown function (DUF3566)
VTSPNEPGYPRAADGPGNADGATPDDSETGSIGNAMGRGHVTDSGDTPPWQRGPAARAQKAPPRSVQEPSRPEAQQGGGPAGQAPGVDARLNRFISGGSAAPASAPETADQPPPRSEPPRSEPPRSEPPRSEPARSEPPRSEPPRSEPPRSEPPVSEAYASELPDLSGAIPRTPQRGAVAERSEPQAPARAAVPGRVQVASRPRQSGPVRAAMQIRRIDPWSALKVSLVLSVALFFVWMIAVAFLYLVLGGMGVWSKLNSNVGDLLTSAGGQSGGELVSSGTIFGGATLIGLVNIVLLTAMATVGVFIYNLTTDLVGGIEVTLADRD